MPPTDSQVDLTTAVCLGLADTLSVAAREVSRASRLVGAGGSLAAAIAHLDAAIQRLAAPHDTDLLGHASGSATPRRYRAPHPHCPRRA